MKSITIVVRGQEFFVQIRFLGLDMFEAFCFLHEYAENSIEAYGSSMEMAQEQLRKKIELEFESSALI